jgi:hypothetical protein
MSGVAKGVISSHMRMWDSVLPAMVEMERDGAVVCKEDVGVI